MRKAELLQASVERIRERTGDFQPRVAVILGSGLGGLEQALRPRAEISYADIPVFPPQRVAGHDAKLLLGRMEGVDVALFCGRFHVYQGLNAHQATVPVRLAGALGCEAVLLTCAVGGIGRELAAGDFLLVKDHLNFSTHNPLQGVVPPAFVDLHDCYRQDFEQTLERIAREHGRRLLSGVLAYMPGPSYETPAEITALGRLGADAVGMSSVLEAIMARALGLQVATLASITNLAGGSADEPLSHADVLSRAESASIPFLQMVRAILPVLLMKQAGFNH